MDVVPGYEPLAEVFQTAHDQAARGKGLIRHANAKPFLQQPIFSIGRMVGIGYNVGQAMKKGQEAMRLPDNRAQAELLGAMVYLASAYLLIGERMETEKRAAIRNRPALSGTCDTCSLTCKSTGPQVGCNGWVPQDARETARAAFTPVQGNWADAYQCRQCKNTNCTSAGESHFMVNCEFFTPVQEEGEDLDGLMPREYPFAFPPALKWMGKSETEYDEKLIEEVDEVIKAKDSRERMMELLDVLHVVETAVRTLAEKTGLDPAAAIVEVIRKNSARNYYQG